MKKIVLIIAFLAAPAICMAQDANTKPSEAPKSPVIKTEVTIKKVEPISNNPKTQFINLNYKKSNDLISIKAYMKSLQMKRNETLMS